MKPEGSQVVLIVDDEPDMCWALENVVKRMGFATARAESGQKALGLAGRIPFHLAFVDAKLPDAEGIELASQLHQLQPGLRVVMVSGYYCAEETQVQEWMKEGAIIRFISKPFLFEQVYEVLRET